MRVIGTAGHVDHGKSTLIAALTGTHPDRLKEEQEREMTIDLGFGWMTLPNGEDVGIVDVPGHRDFIENMLAGVGGIDAALFVVAADEGVMPQTREHLAILDILQIQTGIIVLTKIDMIDDPEWLDMVETDVRQAVAGTVLEKAPLARVSARAGTGLAQLKQVMVDVLGQGSPRLDLGRPRLPVDRIFTVAGFGTVVTGTLIDGRLRTGDEVEILPAGLRGRVRGLQTHKQKEDTAVPGSRTAVNISGVSVEQVARGSVVALAGAYRPTQRLDARFRLLPDASAPLKHNQEAKFFIGAAEVLARVRLLGSEELAPGDEGWLQLELADPVVAVRGDRYILRRPSPGETLGGGVVVDPQPRRRHRRFAPDVLERLDALLAGTPGDVLRQAALALGIAPLRDVVARARQDAAQAREAIDELAEAGLLAALEPGELTPTSDVLVAALQTWQAETARAANEVGAYHKAYPLRRGIPREQLKSRLKMPPRLFNAFVRKSAAEGLLADLGSAIALASFEVRLSPKEQAAAKSLLGKFQQSPYAPPTIKDAQAEVGEELYNALVESGQLVAVSPEVVFRREDYEHMVQAIREHLEQHGTITLAEFRDRFNTSRRYAQALMEHLDALGVTTREGDARRLGKAAAPLK